MTDEEDDEGFASEVGWVVPKLGSWVMTKTKRIGVIGWVDKDIVGNVYMLFPDGHSRSYSYTSLTLLDPPMQKMLSSIHEEFYKTEVKGRI